MKCINCHTDNDIDEEANLSRCSSCNHPFVFNPTEMSSQTRITDPFFAELLVDISARDTLFFTPRQLYYLLAKRLRLREDNIPQHLLSVFRVIFTQILDSNISRKIRSCLIYLFKVIGKSGQYVLTPIFIIFAYILFIPFVPIYYIILPIYIILPKNISGKILHFIGIALGVIIGVPMIFAFMLLTYVIFVLGVVIVVITAQYALSYPLLTIFIAISFIACLILVEAELSTSPIFDRRARQKSLKVIRILAVVLSSIGIVIIIVDRLLLPLGIMAILLGLNAAWLNYKGQQQQKKIYTANSNLLIDRTEFDTWLNKWISINDRSTKMLPSPETYSLPATTNPEVTAYSFDRAIICDTPAIAQILISNNFHFDNNCAILTIDGYPQNIFDMTMEILYRNPNLKVYAFHDCTPNGIKLARQLRARETWFPNPAIPIIDVGILPRQIMNNLDVMTLQSQESAQISRQLHPDIRASLNRAELAWLDAGCYLELESFSSQKLIHILRRAISESRELSTMEYGSMITMDNSGFYTAENFG